MTDRPRIDLDELLEQIDRYLGAVDLFRSVDCEPSWRPETSPPIRADAISLEEEHAQSIR